MTLPNKDPSRLAKNARGDSVTKKKLTGYAKSAQYLHENSVIDYLEENEHPHYFLYAGGDPITYNGKDVASGTTTTRSLVVTDQRILIIVKTWNDEAVWELAYTHVENVDSNKGRMKHTLNITTSKNDYEMKFPGSWLGPFGFDYDEINSATSYIQNLSDKNRGGITDSNISTKDPFTDLPLVSPSPANVESANNNSNAQDSPEQNQGGLGELFGKGNDDDDLSFRERVREIQKARNADQDQPSTQMGSSVEASEKNTRSPKKLVEQAKGDIKLKHLKDTSGRVISWLDKPVVEYLRHDEQPEFIFADLQTKLEFEHPDGTSGEIGYSEGAQFLVITDKRILYVNGRSSGLKDEILVREYDDIEKVGAEGGWLSDGIGFVDEDGVKFRFGVTGNTDLDDAIEYVDKNIHNPREIDPEIQELVANAEGKTVTYEALTERLVLAALDEDEQPHHLLEGNALLIDGGGEVEKKGGAGGTVITIVTNKRVLCNIEGRGIVNVPYDSITSVEYGLPPEDEWEVNIPLLGEFSGQTEKLIINSQGRTYYLDLSERLGILPDSLVEQDNEEYAEFIMDVINFIRNKRDEFKNQSNPPESKTTESDPLDQIERLKELNEQDAITDEEFQEKKSDLLDQV